MDAPPFSLCSNRRALRLKVYRGWRPAASGPAHDGERSGRTQRKKGTHMIERKFWFVTGAGRGLDGDPAETEPSHIHVPRRRRVASDAGTSTTATWRARVDHGAYGAPPVDPPVDSSTAEAHR